MRPAAPLARQALTLRQRFPDSKPTLKCGKLRWETRLRPTPLSREYRVRLAYAMRSDPTMTILDDLKVNWEKPPPHLYGDQSICLHDKPDWNSSMLLVETIVPWTCEWLAHFELWSINGVWYGDEAQSPPPVTAFTQEGRRRTVDKNLIRKRRARAAGADRSAS